MVKMEIPVELNKDRRTGKIIFAGKDDLDFVNVWRKTLADDQNPRRVDAVDFAQVAAHRYEAHSSIEPYAKRLEDIGDHITNNDKCEVACLILLKCQWFPDSEVIGATHFRRIWSNRIVLDYLTIHPFIVRPPTDYSHEVNGVGTALLYFLSTVAKHYNCDAFWGEATQSSHSFYEHVLKLDSVQDLIYAPQKNYCEFIDRMNKAWQEKDSTTTSMRNEIYAAETQNPPFVGSKTAVFNPARRLAYRFLKLPHHRQIEIAKTLGLYKDEDKGLEIDELYSCVFRRARNSNKLSDLWRKVEDHYPDGEPNTNPFHSQ